MSLILNAAELADLQFKYSEPSNESIGYEYNIAKAQAQHMRDAIDEFEKDYWADSQKMSAKQFCEKYHISLPPDMRFDAAHFRVIFNMWIAAEGLD